MNPTRWAAFGCLVLPAVANAVLHLVDPLTADDNGVRIAQAVAHPALTSLMQGQYLLLLFAPGALFLARLAQPARRLAGSGGAVLCLAALVNAPALTENSVLAVAARSTDPQLWARTFDVLSGAPGSGVMNAFELGWRLGSLLGFVVLGIALLRARTVPAWSAWTVMVAVVLNVAGHVVPGPYLDIVAWLALATGLAGCCWRVNPGRPVLASGRASTADLTTVG